MPNSSSEFAQPDDLAGLAVEAGEDAADSLGVNVPRLGVAHDVRPTEPRVGNVGEVDVEPPFPLLLARGCIDANDFLAFISGAGFVAAP